MEKQIDQVGRITIPKEMRYTLGWKPNAYIHMKIENNRLILQQVPKLNLLQKATPYLNQLMRLTKKNVAVFDRTTGKGLISNNGELKPRPMPETVLASSSLPYEHTPQKEPMYLDSSLILLVLPITINTRLIGMLLLLEDKQNNTEYAPADRKLAELMVHSIQEMQ